MYKKVVNYMSIATTPLQKVFDTAIHLLDEQNETSGATLTQDTQEYKVRTITLANTLLEELYPASATYDSSLPGRPVPKLFEAEQYRNPDFTQIVPLDDALAVGVMPYGLAALFVLNEDSEKYRILMGMYRQNLESAKRTLAAEWEPITSPYGWF